MSNKTHTATLAPSAATAMRWKVTLEDAGLILVKRSSLPQDLSERLSEGNDSQDSGCKEWWESGRFMCQFSDLF